MPFKCGFASRTIVARSAYSAYMFFMNTGPQVIKLFPCQTQLSRKFIMLIIVKMPTSVGILTFISMIDRTSERLKARNFFICRYFSFYEQLKFRAQLSWAWKKFATSRPGPEPPPDETFWIPTWNAVPVRDQVQYYRVVWLTEQVD